MLHISWSLFHVTLIKYMQVILVMVQYLYPAVTFQVLDQVQL